MWDLIVTIFKFGFWGFMAYYAWLFFSSMFGVNPKVNKWDDWWAQVQEDGFELTNEIKAKVYGEWMDEDLTMFIDDNNKKFFFQEKFLGIPQAIYDYSDLLGFEISEDGHTVLEGSVGRALIGSWIGGTTGAIIGSSFSKNIEEHCNSISLILYLNNPSCPSISISVNKQKMKKGSKKYRKVVEHLNELVGALTYIQNNNQAIEGNNYIEESYEQAHNEVATSSETAQNNDIDIIEALEKYHSLLDKGILTQEEFDTKKRQLLEA